MLDGRIDMQGTVKELREQNLLDFVVHDDVQELEPSAPKIVSAEDAAAAVLPTEGEEPAAPATKKKARKLVKDEGGATGNVKWPIYKTYLEAWYVELGSTLNNTPD